MIFAAQSHGVVAARFSCMPELTARALNELTWRIIGAAMEVHRILGPGLFEATYVKCLCYELTQRELSWEARCTLPLVYKGLRVARAYEIDIMVEGCIVLEIKALEAFAPIHAQQVYTYLRLSGCRVGLLLNFGGKQMKDGIKRIVHDFPEE